MKSQKRIILFSGIISVLVILSCTKKEDYSSIVYKNYLSYGIESATDFLATTTEGSSEGEYHTGAKQTYQNSIDAATLVLNNDLANQPEIDAAYTQLLQASEDFYDQMVPFRSAFQVLIDYAEFIYSTTEEGTQEGDVPVESKESLQKAITEANSIIAMNDLTQRLLDEATIELQNEILSFNMKIIGKAQIAITNHSYELPGYETDNFGEVDGWNNFGAIEDWAPKTAIILNDSTPDGEFAAKIGSYTQGIYQACPELVQPNAEYTLHAKVSLMSNSTDWEGKRYPVLVRTRLITFNEGSGNYNFISVIGESLDTLGKNPTEFLDIELSVDVDATSFLVGKKLAIDFIQRHTFDPENPIWAESYISLDDIKLSRQF